jgi:hypothetical protein
MESENAARRAGYHELLKELQDSRLERGLTVEQDILDAIRQHTQNEQSSFDRLFESCYQLSVQRGFTLAQETLEELYLDYVDSGGLEGDDLLGATHAHALLQGDLDRDRFEDVKTWDMRAFLKHLLGSCPGYVNKLVYKPSGKKLNRDIEYEYYSFRWDSVDYFEGEKLEVSGYRDLFGSDTTLQCKAEKSHFRLIQSQGEDQLALRISAPIQPERYGLKKALEGDGFPTLLKVLWQTNALSQGLLFEKIEEGLFRRDMLEATANHKSADDFIEYLENDH